MGDFVYPRHGCIQAQGHAAMSLFMPSKFHRSWNHGYGWDGKSKMRITGAKCAVFVGADAERGSLDCQVHPPAAGGRGGGAVGRQRLLAVVWQGELQGFVWVLRQLAKPEGWLKCQRSWLASSICQSCAISRSEPRKNATPNGRRMPR